MRVSESGQYDTTPWPAPGDFAGPWLWGVSCRAMQTTVLGAGSWGTALTLLLARNGQAVTLVARDEESERGLREHRENLQYLPGHVLPAHVAYSRVGEPQEGDILILAVPSGAVEEVLPLLTGHPRICIATKGLGPGGGMLSDLVQDAHPLAKVAVFSGPNLAAELAAGVPTAAVAASDDQETALLVRQAFHSPTFRVYVTDDTHGVELAGALKNVLALAAGMSDGLGYGDNTKAALLSRGLSEIARLGLALGARLETFLGVAGVGDLFATANSRLSRNYRVGRALSEGRKLEEFLQELGQVAEGVPTCEAAVGLARSIPMECPIIEAVYGVIKGTRTPKETVGRLMERTTLHEGLGDIFSIPGSPTAPALGTIPGN